MSVPFDVEEPDVEGPDGEEDEDFDDLPSTHLDDDAYEDFVTRELDAEGAPRAAPPVTAVILILVALVLALAFVALR